MRVTEFLNEIAEKTPALLPDNYHTVKNRRRGSLIQFWFERPQIHYEVWVQSRQQRVEVGLHLEAQKSLNDRLLQYLAQRFIAIQAELGQAVELEQWTQSWGRVHQFVPYERLESRLCDEVARTLAHMITVLEPLCREALGYHPRIG